MILSVFVFVSSDVKSRPRNYLFKRNEMYGTNKKSVFVGYSVAAFFKFFYICFENQIRKNKNLQYASKCNEKHQKTSRSVYRQWGLTST